MIVQRGEAIGLDWRGTMARMQQHDWEAEMDAVANPGVTYPDYYTQPFHAYEKVRHKTSGAGAGRRARRPGGWAPRTAPGHGASPWRKRRMPAHARQRGGRADAACPRTPTRGTPPRPAAPPQGNLSWDAALEVTLAAQSVHAGVMDPANKDWRPE